MRPEVFLIYIVTVIRCHHREPQLFTDADDFLVDPVLIFQLMVLQFEKKVALSHDLRILAGNLDRTRNIFPVHVVGDFSTNTGTQGDQAFRVFCQEFLVDARLVIEPFQISLGHQL